MLGRSKSIKSYPKKLRKDSKESVEQIDIKDINYNKNRKNFILITASIFVFIMISLLKLGRYDTFHMIYLLNGNDQRLTSRVKFDLTLLLILSAAVIIFILVLWLVEKKHYNLHEKLMKFRMNTFYTLFFSFIIFCGFNMVIYKNYFNSNDPIAHVINENIDHELDTNFKRIPMWINDEETVNKLSKKLNIKPNELRLYVVLKVLNKNDTDIDLDDELLHPYHQKKDFDNSPEKMNRYTRIINGCDPVYLY